MDKGTVLGSDTGVANCGAMEDGTNTGVVGRGIGASIGTAVATDDGVGGGGGALRMI